MAKTPSEGRFVESVGRPQGMPTSNTNPVCAQTRIHKCAPALTFAFICYMRYRNKVYNKLFTKILDSSVWLESDATRLVWITFIAIMDEDGFVALSAVGNVASRARVSIEDAERAIAILEAPDPTDPHQDHDGRRIERVPYGWMVLNSQKYRDIILRETAKIETRARVAKYREKKKGVTHVTESNAPVTASNEKVTLSVAVEGSNTNTETSRSTALKNAVDKFVKSKRIP